MHKSTWHSEYAEKFWGNISSEMNCKTDSFRCKSNTAAYPKCNRAVNNMFFSPQDLLSSEHSACSRGLSGTAIPSPNHHYPLHAIRISFQHTPSGHQWVVCELVWTGKPCSSVVYPSLLFFSTPLSRLSNPVFISFISSGSWPKPSSEVCTGHCQRHGFSPHLRANGATALPQQ